MPLPTIKLAYYGFCADGFCADGVCAKWLGGMLGERYAIEWTTYDNADILFLGDWAQGFGLPPRGRIVHVSAEPWDRILGSHHHIGFSPGGGGDLRFSLCWHDLDPIAAAAARPPISTRRAVTYLNSNPTAEREAFLDACDWAGLEVISGGGHRNNAGQVPRGHDAGREFRGRGMFTVAFENTWRPGYVSEKVADAFASGAVPLWWGADLPGDFNRRAVIAAPRDLADRDAARAFAARLAKGAQQPPQRGEKPMLGRLFDRAVLRAFLFNITEQCATG